MRKIIVALLVLLLAMPAGFAEKSKAKAKAQFQNEYLSFLKSEGYQGSVDEDGDVEFKYEGKTYYLIVEEDDPEFFYILFPNFWEMESDQEYTRAAYAASVASKGTKLAKVFMSGDSVSIAAQIFIVDRGDYKKFFNRMMSCIDTALDTFREEMNKGEV